MTVEFNAKQIKKMKDLLINFLEYRTDLFSLVSSLEFLFSVIDIEDPEWNERFISQISLLESINASKPKLSETKIKEIVENAVNYLNKMTDDMLVSLSSFSFFNNSIEIDFDWHLCPKCSEAWKISSNYPIEVCPKCDSVWRNPQFEPKK